MIPALRVQVDDERRGEFVPQRSEGEAGCEIRKSAEEGGGADYGPGREFPDGEGEEGGKGDGEVGGVVDGGGPDGLIEGGQEDAYYAGVDAGKEGAGFCAEAEVIPEGEDADDEQESGEKDGEQGDDGSGCAVWLRMDDCAEVGGEGEERAGEGLGGAVACEEIFVGDPAGADGGGLEKRKDDVAAAKNQGAGAVKSLEEGDGLIWF